MRVNDKGVVLGPIPLDDERPQQIADVAMTLTALGELFAGSARAQPYR
jgi:hypothetical protein